MQVAQSARGFLQVRFKRVRRVLMPRVALFLFKPLGVEKRFWIERVREQGTQPLE